MRLFIAIELDEPTRAAIVREQRRLAAVLRDRAGDDGGLRMVRPEQLHLTLVFLGEATETQAADLQAALAAPVPLAAFTLTFGGAGLFPPRGNPRVLWLGLLAGSDETRAVHADLIARVVRVGATVEERSFTPHLTLGRWRDGRPRHRAALEAAAATPAAASCRVEGVTLFRSELSSGGAVHTPLVTTPLYA